MNYWLFQIMHEDRSEWKKVGVNQPPVWQNMVRNQVAAQNYAIAPHPIYGDNIEYNESYERTCKRNLRLLKQLNKGDWVVAAFKHLRFAGYGQLTTDFYIDGPSLEIFDPVERLEWGFYERFGCDWNIIPFYKKPIDCHDLAAPVPGKRRPDIWLDRGASVKQIAKPVFDKLKARLDLAGAKAVSFSKE